MSISVYSAFKFPANRLDEIKKLVYYRVLDFTFEKLMDYRFDEAVLQDYLEKAIWHEDRTAEQKRIMTQFNLSLVLQEEIGRGEHPVLKGSVVDLNNHGMTLYMFEDYCYGWLSKPELDSWILELADIYSWFEEYEYDNRGDSPTNMSEKEWDARGNVWDNLLGYDNPHLYSFWKITLFGSTEWVSKLTWSYMQQKLRKELEK